MTTAADYVDAVASDPAVAAARAKMDEANATHAAAREAVAAAQRLATRTGDAADRASDEFWAAVAAAQPGNPDDDILVVVCDDGHNRPTLLGGLEQGKRAACVWAPADAAAAEAKASEMQSYINRVTSKPTETLYVVMPIRAARQMAVAKGGGQLVEMNAAFNHAMAYVQAGRLVVALTEGL